MTKEQIKQLLDWAGRFVVAIITFLLYQVQTTLSSMNSNLVEMKIMVATYGKEVEALKAEFIEHRAFTNQKFNSYDNNINEFYKHYKLEPK